MTGVSRFGLPRQRLPAALPASLRNGAGLRGPKYANEKLMRPSHRPRIHSHSFYPPHMGTTPRRLGWFGLLLLHGVCTLAYSELFLIGVRKAIYVSFHP